MKKPISQILIEAVVIGQLVLYTYWILTILVLPNLINIIDLTHNNIMIIFLTGFFVHIISEMSGINLWYVKNYTSILQTIESNIKK
jgi:hypothetical protein